MFCKDVSSGWSFNTRNANYIFGIFLKTLEQALVYYKLDNKQTKFSAAFLVLITWWLLFPVIVVGDVTVTVVKDVTCGLCQDMSFSTTIDLVMPVRDQNSRFKLP
jgi:hypothetical protein